MTEELAIAGAVAYLLWPRQRAQARGAHEGPGSRGSGSQVASRPFLDVARDLDLDFAAKVGGTVGAIDWSGIKTSADLQPVKDALAMVAKAVREAGEALWEPLAKAFDGLAAGSTLGVSLTLAGAPVGILLDFATFLISLFRGSKAPPPPGVSPTKVFHSLEEMDTDAVWQAAQILSWSPYTGAIDRALEDWLLHAPTQAADLRGQLQILKAKWCETYDHLLPTMLASVTQGEQTSDSWRIAARGQWGTKVALDEPYTDDPVEITVPVVLPDATSYPRLYTEYGWALPRYRGEVDPWALYAWHAVKMPLWVDARVRLALSAWLHPGKSQYKKDTPCGAVRPGPEDDWWHWYHLAGVGAVVPEITHWHEDADTPRQDYLNLIINVAHAVASRIAREQAYLEGRVL